MTLTLRKATLTDRNFARRIHHQTMKDYVKDFFGEWNDTHQDERFDKVFKPARTWIILWREQEVGWLERHEMPEDILLAEFYIAPDHQRQGIGTRLLRDLKSEARSKGKSVSLGVLKNNPARRLYEREGFAVVGENEYKFLMKHDAREGTR